MASCASAAQIGAIAIASASAPSINRMGEPSLRRVATGSAPRVVARRSLSLSDLLVARESASPPRNALRQMLVPPLGDLGRHLNHALHQRLRRSELQPLFVDWLGALSAHTVRINSIIAFLSSSGAAPSLRLWHFEGVAATARWSPRRARRRAAGSPQIVSG